MLKLLLAILLLTGLAAAGETLILDGLAPGQAPAGVSWLPHPCPDGRYEHEGTTVEVSQGRIATIWGSELRRDGEALLRRNDPVDRVVAVLGKPDQVLYGCGSGPGQQVYFYPSRGLDVTLEGKVTGLVLRQPEK